MELHIAFLHMAVQYKQPEKNKAELLASLRKAAENGAHLIIAPEMAVSGYSFTSRADIAPYIEPQESTFHAQLAQIAQTFGSYLCVGMAICEADTASYYNSAMVYGPDGFTFRYDKINGEIRWSRPGDPCQNACFDTPWGRVGILICSDTYYELQARVVALQGADLLVVPANWPSSGLRPVELWQARALENGVALAGCNRTGQDLLMSCEEAESCLFNEYGECIFRGSSPDTSLFTATLPLLDGRLNSQQRQECLSKRKVETYHSCYRSVNAVQNLSSFLELPDPGKLSLHCLILNHIEQTLEPGQGYMQALDQQLCVKAPQDGETPVWLLSLPEGEAFSLEPFTVLAQAQQAWLVIQQGKQHFLIDTQGQKQVVKDIPLLGDAVYPQVNIGPARAVFMDYQAILHPENTMAASKQGCDLVVLCHDSFPEDIALLCGVRTISNLCMALSTPEGGGIWMRPEGHGRWDEKLTGEHGYCSSTLDTALTRMKRFQDRVDFDSLLAIKKKERK